MSVRTSRPPELSTSPVPLGLARRDFSIAAACLTGAGLVKPEFSTRPGSTTTYNSPVTNHRRPCSQRIGFAKSSGSGRTNKHEQTGPPVAADGDLSTRRRAPAPHDIALTKGQTPSVFGPCSRQHKRRGGENRWRGAGGSGCQAGQSLPDYRFPPPDSGVVPFSEVRSSPIKSVSRASGRVGCRSEPSSRLHLPPSSWGRNVIL